MNTSDGPVVFDGMSFPRPRNPVVLEGSPLFASEFAFSGTAISVSFMQWVLLVPIGLVVVMDVWLLLFYSISVPRGFYFGESGIIPGPFVVSCLLFVRTMEYPGVGALSIFVCSSHETSMNKVRLVLHTKV